MVGEGLEEVEQGLEVLRRTWRGFDGCLEGVSEGLERVEEGGRGLGKTCGAFYKFGLPAS